MGRWIDKVPSEVGFLISFTAVALLFAGDPAPLAAQFSNRTTTTPIWVQDGFGPAGDALPFNGVDYCFPTGTAMSLSYLGVNGFNEIGPSNPTAANGLNMIEVMAGLMGTDSINGTTNNPGWVPDIETYLAAKGISTSNYNLTVLYSPTISDLAGNNQPGTVIDLGCGYYDSSGDRVGGHCVTLLSQEVNAQGQFSPNMLAINNPAASTFAPVPDTAINSLKNLNTVSTTGNLTGDGALEWDPNQFPGFWGNTGVIETAICLTINPSQMSANNPTPATWTLSSSQAINLQNGYLSVLGLMAGAGGIVKGDGGTLELEAPDSTSGSP